MRGRGRGRVGRAVAVEIPGVGEGVRGVRVRRARGVEVDRERERAVRRVGGGKRVRCGVRGAGRADAPDRPRPDVHVVEVAAGAHLQVHRIARVLREDDALVRVGQAVGPGPQRPDAVARVVGEEQRAGVRRRERAAAGRVERQPGERVAGVRAVLPAHDRGVVVVGPVRGRDRAALGVEVLADVEVQRVEAAEPVRALVARPAVVAGRAVRVGVAVDLLPARVADVADPCLAGPRADRQPERVPEPVGDDAPRLQVRAREEGVAGHAQARVRVDADQRPVQAGRVRRRAHVLCAQAPALGRRRREGRPRPARWVTAGVDRVPVLPVVVEVPGRAVAAGHVQVSVGAEVHPSAGVARVLHAPVLDQHLLRARHHVAVGGQPGHPAAHDAAVARAAGRVGAGVAPPRAPCRRSRRRARSARTHRAGPGSSGAASSPRGRGPSSRAPSCAGRRTSVGVVSERLSKTFTRPLFSATNTRPSPANSTAMGWSSPLKVVLS